MLGASSSKRGIEAVTVRWESPTTSSRQTILSVVAFFAVSHFSGARGRRANSFTVLHGEVSTSLSTFARVLDVRAFEALILSGDNKHRCTSAGLAHGFCVTSDRRSSLQVHEFYSPKPRRESCGNDPISDSLPMVSPNLSEKDRSILGPRLGASHYPLTTGCRDYLSLSAFPTLPPFCRAIGTTSVQRRLHADLNQS